MKFRVIASIVVVAALAAVVFLTDSNSTGPKKASVPADDAALKSLSIN